MRFGLRLPALWLWAIALLHATAAGAAAPVPGAGPAAAPSVPGLLIDGKRLAADVGPVLVNGYLMVPLRALTEGLGAAVGWSGQTKEVVVRWRGREIRMTAGEPVASVDGEPRALAAPPELQGGRVLVPLLFLAEVLGLQSRWAPDGSALTIDSQAGPAAVAGGSSAQAATAPGAGGASGARSPVSQGAGNGTGALPGGLPAAGPTTSGASTPGPATTGSATTGEGGLGSLPSELPEEGPGTLVAVLLEEARSMTSRPQAAAKVLPATPSPRPVGDLLVAAQPANLPASLQPAASQSESLQLTGSQPAPSPPHGAPRGSSQATGLVVAAAPAAPAAAKAEVQAPAARQGGTGPSPAPQSIAGSGWVSAAGPGIAEPETARGLSAEEIALTLPSDLAPGGAGSPLEVLPRTAMRLQIARPQVAGLPPPLPIGRFVDFTTAAVTDLAVKPAASGQPAQAGPAGSSSSPKALGESGLAQAAQEPQPPREARPEPAPPPEPESKPAQPEPATQPPPQPAVVAQRPAAGPVGAPPAPESPSGQVAATRPGPTGAPVRHDPGILEDGAVAQAPAAALNAAGPAAQAVQAAAAGEEVPAPDAEARALPAETAGSVSERAAPQAAPMPQTVDVIAIAAARERGRARVDLVFAPVAGPVPAVTTAVLTDPDRLVIDLAGATLRTILTEVQAYDPVLKRVRAAQFTPDTVRVVMELSGPSGYQVQPRTDGSGVSVLLNHQVRGVDLVRLEEGEYQLRLDATDRMDYTVSALPDPDRLIIDLLDTTLVGGPQTVSFEEGPARQLRVSQFQPDKTRIVLEAAAGPLRLVGPDGRVLGATGPEGAKMAAAPPGPATGTASSSAGGSASAPAGPASGSSGGAAGKGTESPAATSIALRFDVTRDVVDVAVRPVGAGGAAIVVRVTGDVEPKLSYLRRPDRLVLDIPGARLQAPVAGAAGVKAFGSSSVGSGPGGSGVVVGWRASQFTPDTVRVVAELQQLVGHRLFRFDDGSTLVVTLGSEPLEGKVVAIDPGHGGADPGNPGLPSEKPESAIVLDIALRLAELLQSAGVRVVLTRSDDREVDLYERPQIAARAGAEVLVSIHGNASFSRTARGSETLYIPDRPENRLLAELLQAAMVKELNTVDRGIKVRPNLAVLRSATMPAVLVEVGFFDHPEEGQLFLDPAFRQRAAEALFQGLVSYFGQSGKDMARPAPGPGAQGGGGAG